MDQATCQLPTHYLPTTYQLPTNYLHMYSLAPLADVQFDRKNGGCQ